MNSFLQNHSFPGKQREEEKKAIFATICQNVNENSLEIEPLYPDLIKEYMFCFYMQKSKMRFTVTLLLVRAVCAASSAQAPTA